MRSCTDVTSERAEGEKSGRGMPLVRWAGAGGRRQGRVVRWSWTRPCEAWGAARVTDCGA